MPTPAPTPVPPVQAARTTAGPTARPSARTTGPLEPIADRPLADGLVLRSARPGDVDGIVALELAAFGEADGPIVAARLAHPFDGWLVVEDPADGGRIVSASVLLSHDLQLGPVTVPIGQIEDVATDPAYQRRRLVRSQFEVHHERSAARGDLAVLITGIPYLYRRLGYGYGLDFPRIHVLDADAVGDSAVAARPATIDDLPGIERLDAERSTDVLRVVRDRNSWVRTLARSEATRFEQLVVAERDDQIVGFAQLEARPRAGRLYVEPGMAGDPEAARGLLAHAVAQGASHGELVLALANPGTVYGATLDEIGRSVTYTHGIYVRVPDPVALIDRLRPILSERLAASRYADRSGELVISMYESGVAISYDGGAVVGVRAVDPIEDPFDSDDVGVPPDQVGALLLGRFGAEALEQRVDDVTLGRRRRLMEVLFPRVEAELLADL